jgi:hypothetical protein
MDLWESRSETVSTIRKNEDRGISTESRGRTRCTTDSQVKCGSTEVGLAVTVRIVVFAKPSEKWVDEGRIA